MTAPMTPKLDEARLRELAEAATPGPWTAVRCLRGGSSIDADEREVVESDEFGRFGAIEVEADAAFIAAANPATLLSLLDALSAERERSEYRIAEAYQVIGAIADAGGLFEHPDVQRALTYFSEAEPEDEILPFSLADQKAGGEKK